MAERENRRAARMRHAPWIAALAGLLVVGCSQTAAPAPPKARPNPMATMNMGGDTGMGNPLLPNQTDPTATSYNVNTSEELAKIDNGAEGEVYFTDPDNPDKEIEGITAAFESTRSGNAWMTDYGRALRFARREGRPCSSGSTIRSSAPRAACWVSTCCTRPSSTLGARIAWCA